MAYQISLLTIMGIAVIFALSLNLITGFCGQISLGHAAFLGTGAYAAALLAKAGFGLVPALLGGGLLAGAFGVVVGLASLRVRHDFLAITTMGINFVFLGIVLALPIGLAAARNLMPVWTTWPARAVIALCRSFHPVIVAIVFMMQ